MKCSTHCSTHYSIHCLTQSLITKAVFIAVTMVAASLMSAADMQNDWKKIVADRLPLYGHRNWIVIADSAYPAQARTGIETVVSGAGQVEVLKQVLASLAASKHVRANIYLDRELQFVNEADAPGADRYRKELEAVLGSANRQTLLHEAIIEKLDKTGETFKVLLIKTTMTVPYTSVFLQLDCAYWSDDAEKRMRQAMIAGR